jgi:branched-chain amino acid aminotransferase
MDKIKIELSKKPKEKPDQDNLGFGRVFSDHMFIMDYTDGTGWHDPRIIPYQPLIMEPSTMVLHYGQAIFEGLKAYKSKSGDVHLFRPDMNMKRINNSCDRMCLPTVDEEFCVKAIKELVNVDREWIPEKEDASLYIRPFIISTDTFLGVRPSLTYQFIIILSPSGSYYPEGVNPVKIFVEDEYVRAIKGGTGYTKTIGNYAASLRAQKKAKEKGYVQVLWLDGCEKKYVEEVGSMNVFFKIDNKIITPELSGSILSGITRNSTIHMLRDWGYEVSEEKISIDYIYDSYKEGKLEEAFGTGTACVISPIGVLNWKNRIMNINDGKIGELTQKLYDTLTGIQYGKVSDKYNWIVKL